MREMEEDSSLTYADPTSAPSVATFQRLYATKAEYVKTFSASGTLNGDEGNSVHTVSTNPDEPGWNIDGGCSGYGMSKEWAEQIAREHNSHATLMEALRTSSKTLLLMADAFPAGSATRAALMEEATRLSLAADGAEIGKA